MVHAEVAAAIAAGRPVVALESTIISHGLPRPENLRVAAEVEDIVPRAASASRISLLLLDPPDPVTLADAPRLRGLVKYRVRGQGAAPNSTVPHLGVQVTGMAQVWFDSVVDMEEAAAGWIPVCRALFAVEEHWLDPVR